jgi:pimeloyl-ACP methyl ester carboxylesterase
LLLIHGFCESGALFAPIVERLAQHATVLLPDLPGFGGTAFDPHFRQLDDYAFWLRDLMDTVGWPAATVVGHSMGGYIALGLAAHCPERVNALGLLHSTALDDTEDRKLSRTKTMDFLAANGMEAFLRVFVPALFHDPAADWLEALYAIGRQTELAAAIACTRMMRDRPARVAVAAGLQVPLLYILGGHDTLVPPARSQQELMDVGLALLTRIPEAGHMAMYEAPDTVVEAILSLVAMRAGAGV